MTIVTIRIEMNRPVTDAEGEAAMYAAVASLSASSETDDWGYDVSQEDA